MTTHLEFLILPNGKCPVEEFLDDLDDKTVAKVQRYLEALEENILMKDCDL